MPKRWGRDISLSSRLANYITSVNWLAGWLAGDQLGAASDRWGAGGGEEEGEKARESRGLRCSNVYDYIQMGIHA